MRTSRMAITTDAEQLGQRHNRWSDLGEGVSGEVMTSAAAVHSGGLA